MGPKWRATSVRNRLKSGWQRKTYAGRPMMMGRPIQASVAGRAGLEGPARDPCRRRASHRGPGRARGRDRCRRSGSTVGPTGPAAFLRSAKRSRDRRLSQDQRFSPKRRFDDQALAPDAGNRLHHQHPPTTRSNQKREACYANTPKEGVIWGRRSTDSGGQNARPITDHADQSGH